MYNTNSLGNTLRNSDDSAGEGWDALTKMQWIGSSENPVNISQENSQIMHSNRNKNITQDKSNQEKITLAETYHATENPLTDELIGGAIKARIAAAERGEVNSDSGSMYRFLTVDKTKSETEPNLEDKARFHEKLFQKWKENLATITPEQYQEMLHAGTVGSDFIQMRNYVLNFPTAKYPGQLKKLAEQNGREDLSDLINKYCYDYVSKDGWEYITSYKLNGCQKRDIDGRHIGHRLYLNIPNNKLYQVADKIVDAFKEKNLPFEFKFDDSNQTRRESIVFYCETEQLTDNIQVLRELKKNNPALFGTIEDPPIATGKMDNWIGYGSDPENTGKESFNTLRSKALWKGITDTTVDWVDKNKNVKNKDGISIKEIIAHQAIIDKKAKLHSNSKVQNHEKLQADILANFDDALAVIREDSTSIKSQTMSDEKIGAIWKVQYHDLANTIVKFIPAIEKINPDFHQQCKQNILEACGKYGIHRQNFAYDEWALQEMVKSYQNKMKST